jgi:hypothetical protein
LYGKFDLFKAQISIQKFIQLSCPDCVSIKQRQDKGMTFSPKLAPIFIFEHKNSKAKFGAYSGL